MIERILPEWVSVVEHVGPADDAELLPEEAATMGGAVDSRRREFSCGRRCAREAMARLGANVQAVPRGANREPLWPDGIAGSITHTKGYCAAAVARLAGGKSLGIDCEPDGPLPKGVLDKVSTPAERVHLATLPEGIHWDRLLFSAKESVYKALWPQVRDWIGFSDAELRFVPERATFHAAVSSPVRVEVEGRYLVQDGFVMTSVCLESNEVR